MRATKSSTWAESVRPAGSLRCGVARGVGPEGPVLVAGESAEFGFDHDVGSPLRRQGGPDVPDQGDVVLVRQ